MLGMKVFFIGKIGDFPIKKHFTQIGIQIIVNNYLYTETVTSKTLTVSAI